MIRTSREIRIHDDPLIFINTERLRLHRPERRTHGEIVENDAGFFDRLDFLPEGLPLLLGQAWSFEDHFDLLLYGLHVLSGNDPLEETCFPSQLPERLFGMRRVGGRNQPKIAVIRKCPQEPLNAWTRDDVDNLPVWGMDVPDQGLVEVSVYAHPGT